VLQTPSKSFQALTITNSDVRGVLGSEKHVRNFYVSIWREAVSSYVNLNGLRANRYEQMEMYLFVHKDLIGL
jgi:hypothetical protein